MSTANRSYRWFCLVVNLMLVFAVQGDRQHGGDTQFLYVPRGHKDQDGVLLTETAQDQLPPGEYEVVAMFEQGQDELPRPHSQSGGRSPYESDGRPYVPQVPYAPRSSPYGQSAPASPSHSPSSSPFELPGYSVDPSLFAPERPQVLNIDTTAPSPFATPPRGDIPTELRAPTTTLEPPIRDYYEPVDVSNGVRPNTFRPLVNYDNTPTYEHHSNEGDKFKHFPVRYVTPTPYQYNANPDPQPHKRNVKSHQLPARNHYKPYNNQENNNNDDIDKVFSQEQFEQSKAVQEFQRLKQQYYLQKALEQYQRALAQQPSPTPYPHYEPREPEQTRRPSVVSYEPEAYPTQESAYPRDYYTSTTEKPYYNRGRQPGYQDYVHPTNKPEMKLEYDPRRPSSSSSGNYELTAEYWAGYNPGYARNKFAQIPDQVVRIPKEEPTIFVTPIPKRRTIYEEEKSVTKRKISDIISEVNEKKQKDLERLKAIAALRPKTSKTFNCPHDGHFADKDDCAKFYRCAHGKALVEYCPGGLFWNAVTDQCDWPETVDCSYNSVSMQNYKLDEPITLYLTFDDGPNEGTEAILKALRNENVKATFFINSQNIKDPDPKVTARNVNSVLTMIKDGHVLADHSYDHMFHNSWNSPKNAYQDVENDLKYFGVMNTYPILDILWKADLKQYIGAVNHTMSNFVRMPYTNNWRMGSLHKDCFSCTIPASSGQNAITMTNIFHNQGKQIVGWDLEWEIDWSKNRFKYGGKEMFFRMARDPRWSQPKIVILSHDIAHRPYEVRNEQKELESFIALAKSAGYKFDTIDNYL